MRKLCDKNCGMCDLDDCLLKNPPWDWQATEKHRSEASKEQRRKYMKRKREICIAFGICRNCFARKATKGLVCADCYAKQTRNNEKRRKGIHRAERVSYGLCFFCGEPAEKGFKTCEKHHAQMAENVLHTDYTNNQNHIWRKRDKLVFFGVNEQNER